MAKKQESEKVRFVKVHAKRLLGRKVGEATITGKYPTLEAANESPEPGLIMTPLKAHSFLKKYNKDANS